MQLDKLTTFPGLPGPLLLVVMDGIGLAPPGPANAVSLADTPVLDKLLASKFSTRLHAHGTHVGLPGDNDMGNSEVGHNTLGGGRVFAQGAKLVAQAFEDGALFNGKSWAEVEARGLRGGVVHFIGLLSDGNVHSHIAHLFALLERCASAGVRTVRVHVLLDGRDVEPRSAPKYIEQLESKLADINRAGRASEFDYRIASGGGRMVITMDRYQADWPMVKRGFDAHVHGTARLVANAGEEVQRQHAADAKLTDQYLEPFVIADAAAHGNPHGKPHGKPIGAMNDGDAVVLFNFRGDRAIEISRALEEESFNEFDRGDMPEIFFCGMLQYDGDLQVPANYLVEPPRIERSMGEYLCAEKIQTFAVSETQKFGHVTYFWNGNRSAKFDDALETWVEIPSDDMPFERAPAMQAAAITDATIELLRSGEYRFGRINFANGDMVGHSGDIDATVRAVEAVDAQLGRLLDAARACNAALIVTADHGNADEMFVEQHGKRRARTSHTCNPVPFVIAGAGWDDAAGAGATDSAGADSTGDAFEFAEVESPGLANVAATVFNLLGYRAPDDYAPSLIDFRGEPRSRRTIHRGAVLDLGLETVRLPNREILALEIVRHPGGAVVAAQDELGRVALIRQFRHAAGGWIWEFPAGLLEPGESPLDAAKRELREETGCTAAAWQSLGATLTTPGFCTERLHLFLATDLTLNAPDLQPHEFIETHWLALPEVNAMAQRGDIIDAKTLVALLRMQADDG